MSLRQDMQMYLARWQALEAVQAEERRSASLALRWRQLNAAYGMAKGLGFLQPDASEAGVFAKWAKLKEKNAEPRPRA